MKTHLRRAIALALCLILTMLASCSDTTAKQPDNTGTANANNSNSGGNTGSNETYELIFSVASKSSYVANTDMKWFCEEVENRTNGRVHISFYEDAQLYQAEESPTALMSGAIDIMCDGTANLWPDFCPVFDYTEAWFLMTDRESTRAKIEEYRELLFPLWEEIGVKPLAFMDRGTGGILTNRLVEHPLDMKGMQMRGPNAPDWEAMGLLGVTPVQMSTGEQYDAMSKGTLDGSRATYQNFANNNLGDYCKYLYCNVSYSLFAMIMNMDTWNSLPSDIQQVIQEVALEFEEKAFEDVAAEEQGYLDAMAALDVNFLVPTEEEITEFRSVLKPFYDQIMEDAVAMGYGDQAERFLEIATE